jgi:hypothetical protein
MRGRGGGGVGVLLGYSVRFPRGGAVLEVKSVSHLLEANVIICLQNDLCMLLVIIANHLPPPDSGLFYNKAGGGGGPLLSHPSPWCLQVGHSSPLCRRSSPETSHLLMLTSRQMPLSTPTMTANSNSHHSGGSFS